MELTFLGTGAAFAGDANNAAYILDRRILLDAGAPVHILMRQTGHDTGDIEAVVVSHQHGDHTFGLPFFMATRAIERKQAPPLTIVGPPGFPEYISNLLRLSWGDRLHSIVWETLRPRFIEVDDGDSVDVAGFRLQSRRVVHVQDIPCLGFTMANAGVRFGYSGDSGPCPGLDAIVEASRHALVEMTGVDENDHGHMSRAAIERMVGAHPDKSFYLTHLNRRSDNRPVLGATFAEDLKTVELAPD
jgi:ribonuclease BN (tRNA processing enzyme)